MPRGGRAAVIALDTDRTTDDTTRTTTTVETGERTITVDSP
jgi:hypothetical protein